MSVCDKCKHTHIHARAHTYLPAPTRHVRMRSVSVCWDWGGVFSSKSHVVREAVFGDGKDEGPVGQIRGLALPPRDQQGGQHTENVPRAGSGCGRVPRPLCRRGAVLETQPSLLQRQRPSSLDIRETTRV